MSSDFGPRHQIADWLDAEACRLAAELLDDEALVRCIGKLVPADDQEFGVVLVDVELGLIAAGVSGNEAALRAAVIRHLRDALLLCQDIDQLPTAGERSSARVAGKRSHWWQTSSAPGDV